MNSRITMVGTMDAGCSAAEWAEVAAAPCDWLEVRAASMAELDPARLQRAAAGRPLLCTLRPREPGESSDSRRLTELRRAAAVADYVCLDGEHDLRPELLAAVAPERRVISWRDPAAHPARLAESCARSSQFPARMHRFEVGAGLPAGFAALLFLRQMRRRDLVAYARGPESAWTRVLAPRFGAPVVFGRAVGGPAAGGEPGVEDLALDYDFSRLHDVREIYAIVGPSAHRSLSPRLHNRAYRAGGFGRLFLSLPAESFEEFWETVIGGGAMEALGLKVQGLTVASPHKEAALAVAQRLAPLCATCQASNLLIRREDGWTAATTDPEGIFHNTPTPARWRGVHVAVIGCGGSGRIAAAALARAGAQVTLANRSVARGEHAARLLDLPYVPLPRFSPRGFGAIVHATPVGREGDSLPVDLDEVAPSATIIDLTYRREGDTPLVAQARARGHQVIDGREVLLAQTRQQYFLMTGEAMPLDLGREILGLPAHPDREDAGRVGGPARLPLADLSLSLQR